MRVKTAVVWWLVTGQSHPALSANDMNAQGLQPLIDAMFPGINYYSITGFSEVMRTLVMPALRARHADVGELVASDVQGMTEVDEVLSSDGYQWRRDATWMPRFQRAIAA